SVTITFDDGYADNCQFALPLLIRHRIPTVYFVSTVHVACQLPFGHDVAAGRPLRVNSVEQLQAAAAGGIEVGLHTANHCNFDRVHTEEQLQEEITGAKLALESMIDRPVRYLAVPFGMPEQMRPAVFRAAFQCGLQGVCSGFGGYNEVGQDTFHIRRIHGDPQFIRLQNWLSYDPRKVRRTPSLTISDRIPPTLDWLNLAQRAPANSSDGHQLNESGLGLT
ncbi:MAG: polysaccharide deacetylase family protein, partial [Planctomycetota bacterium]